MRGIDLIHLKAVFAENLATALPWVIGAGVLLAAAYFSPLGRAVKRHLRSRGADVALMQAMLMELSELRASLVETTARLQATEEQFVRLKRESSASAFPSPIPPSLSESRVPTPH